nr:helix-turn-helix transcriptional regulator [Kibdelosporangium sp. MJ126-NF4]CTQ91318.1 Putative transcriptional regulator [Kibdelosporangium sp. MJ126-NF4]
MRFYRTAARQTKTVTAGLAGITPDYLYQLERGTKLPTITVLLNLARAIGIPIHKLLDNQPEPSKTAPRVSAGNAIYQALVVPAPAPSTPPALPDLRDRITSAWQTWQTSPQRYSRVSAQLPSLITDTAFAVRSTTTDDRRAAHRYSADLFNLVRTVTKRLGRADLSLLAADRAMCSAEAADDPLCLASARWNLAQVLLADGQADGAETTALHGIEKLQSEVERGTKDALALQGAFRLTAAIAAARQANSWAAYGHLREAEPIAAQTGECNTSWTAFGPTNLGMYRVAVAVETGQAAESLQFAERVDYSQSPSIERRIAFLLDQAKGHLQRRDFSSALVILHSARRQAPEDMIYRPAAHSALKLIISASRRPIATEAARLASKITCEFA